MNTILLILILAQSVNFSTSNFLWDYTGPTVDGFYIKCGVKSKNYTVIKTAPSASRSYPTSNLVTTTGTYYCVCVPYIGKAEAVPTPEYSFTVQPVWEVVKAGTVALRKAPVKGAVKKK